MLPRLRRVSNPAARVTHGERETGTDRSSTVRKLLTRAVGEWKLDHFAEAYRNGQLSLARAAAEAGVSLWEMTAYAQARKIPAQYDEDDLKDDLARVRARR